MEPAHMVKWWLWCVIMKWLLMMGGKRKAVELGVEREDTIMMSDAHISLNLFRVRVLIRFK